MTHEETIKRIQELTNGMALEFGCEVIDLGHLFMGCSDPHTMTLLSYDNPAEYDEPEDAVSSFLHYRGNPDVKIPSQNLFDDKKYKILGKPITLAVVLRAVEKFTGSSDDVLYVNSVGLMYKINSNKTQKDFVKQFENCVEWNLSKDNFNDQSEETKMFIGGLLGN